MMVTQQLKVNIKSKILDWAKQQGIVDKSVSSTFDSMQDLFLTPAL